MTERVFVEVDSSSVRLKLRTLLDDDEEAWERLDLLTVGRNMAERRSARMKTT